MRIAYTVKSKNLAVSISRSLASSPFECKRCVRSRASSEHGWLDIAVVTCRSYACRCRGTDCTPHAMPQDALFFYGCVNYYYYYCLWFFFVCFFLCVKKLFCCLRLLLLLCLLFSSQQCRAAVLECWGNIGLFDGDYVIARINVLKHFDGIDWLIDAWRMAVFGVWVRDRPMTGVTRLLPPFSHVGRWLLQARKTIEALHHSGALWIKFCHIH